MTDFKAKMHQIRFRLCPRPRWGAYSAPQTSLAGFGGRFAAGGGLGSGKGGKGQGEGEGGGKWRGGKGRAPKLLLNNDPSEPIATPLDLS